VKRSEEEKALKKEKKIHVCEGECVKNENENENELGFSKDAKFVCQTMVGESGGGNTSPARVGPENELRRRVRVIE